MKKSKEDEKGMDKQRMDEVMKEKNNLGKENRNNG